MNQIGNPLDVLALYKAGQKEGFAAGVIFSVGAYWLAKTYRPGAVKKVNDQINKID